MFRLRRTIVWPVIATQAAMALPMPALAQLILPTSPSVSAGQAVVGPVNNGMLPITQSTDRAAIRWNSFNIGQGNSVVFQQPTPGAAILNIVTGAQASQLAGNLMANGSVFLVNPQGINVAPTGRIHAAGGFVASTLGLSERDFMDGRLAFGGTGGAVVNEGQISTGAGGLVALIGSTVSNSGTIMAPLGKVALGAAQAATLDWSGDGFLQVTLPSDATTADGQALVTNSGRIESDGGLVTLKAATVAQAVRNAVNMPGSISARSVSGRNGAIVLDGGPGGSTQVSGQLDVSAAADAAGAGRIDLTGQTVALQGAVLDASGQQNGGTVRIGGGFQGGRALADAASPLAQAFGQAIAAPALASARETTVDAASRIDISARAAQGQGGNAVVWSDGVTSMQGQVTGTGGAFGGAVGIASAGNVQTAALQSLALGAGGKVVLQAQDLQINQSYKDASKTTFLTDSQIRAQLEAGTSLDLRVNQDIDWTSGFLFVATRPGVARAGNLNLVAGREIQLEGAFSTGNGDWSITSNASALVDAQRGAGGGRMQLLQARFVNDNGHLALRVADGAGNTERQAGSLGIGSFSGKGLSAAIDASAPGADAERILLYHDVDVAEGIQLTGNLQTSSQGVGGVPLNLRGATVDWTNETSGGQYRGGIVKFIEGGQVTRIGKGGAGADATRLELGSNGTYSRTYGDADPNGDALGALALKLAAHNVTAAQMPLGEVLAAGSLNVSGPGVTAGAGSHRLTLSADAAVAFKGVAYDDEGTAAGGYFINLRPGTVALNVEKRVVTPTALNPNYVYGSPAAAVSFGNVVNGDVLSPLATLGSSAGVAMTANGAGYGFGARVGAGSHAYTVTGLAGATAGNYLLDLSSPVRGWVSVAPKPLTFSGIGASQVYGDAFTPLSMFLDGVLSGDAVQANAQAVRAISANAAGGSGTRATGTYAVDVTSLAGDQAGNYSVAASGNSAPVLQITPRPLSYNAAGAVNSTYGTAAVGLPAATLGNVIAGDLITGNLAAFNAQGANAIDDRTRAGSYALGVGSLSGAGAANYQVAASGNVAGQFEVARKPINFSGSDSSQVYGQSAFASPGLTGTLSGDDVRPGAQQLNMYFGANPGESGALPIGTYEVGLSGLAGADASNYVLQSSGNTPHRVTITPRPLNFTLTGGSSNTTYGTAAQRPDFVLSNVFAGDGISGSLAAFANGVAHAVGAKTPAGSYVWGIDALTGLAAGNYVVSFAGSSLFPLTVAQKPLTWQVSRGSAVYGDALSNATALAGVLPDDDVVGRLQAIDAGGHAVARPVVGPAYTAQVTSLGGAAGGNYALQATGNAAGALRITPRPVGYSVADVNVTYGNLAAPGAVTLSNVVSGETLAPTLDIRAGNGAPVALSERTDAGQYQQQVTALGNANYLLDPGSKPGVLTVAPRALTYATPHVTGTYGDQADLSARGSVSGVLFGDEVRAGATVRHSPYFYPWDAGSYTDVFRVGSLEGSKAGNYVLTDAGSRLGSQTILPRQVTYAVDVVAGGSRNPNQVYGTLRPYQLGTPFNTSAALSGLLPDDRFSVFMQPTAPAMPQSSGGYYNVGAYTWSQGNLTGSRAGNYVIAPSGNTDFTLNITPRSDLMSFYLLRDGAMSVNSIQYGSTGSAAMLLNYQRLYGDDVQATAAVTAGGATYTSLPGRLPVGGYRIGLLGNALSGADAANYRPVVVPLDFQVTQKPLAAQIDGSWSTYGTQAVVSTPRLFGVVEDDQVAGVVTVTNSAGTPVTLAPRSAAGDYGMAITGLAGAGAGNYYLETRNQGANYNFSSRLSIAPKVLGYSVGASDLKLTYGDYVTLPNMLSGVLPGDAVSVKPQAIPLEATATGSHATQDLSTRPLLDAGRYSYAGALSGADAANYRVPEVGTLVVDKRVVTANYLTKDRTYGTYTPTDITLSNIVPGQQLLFANNDYAGYSERSPAGLYNDYLTLTGGNAPNYFLSNPYREWRIAQKPLAISAASQASTTYGTAGSFGAFDVSGIQFNDDVSVLVRGNGLPNRIVAPDASGQLPSLVQQNAGNYAFALSLTGWNSGNYRIAGNSQGMMRIAPKPLTLTAETSASAVYGSAARLATLGGVLFNDDVGVTVAGGLPSARLMPDGSGAVTYSNRVNAGSYGFAIGSALSGEKSGNYLLADGASGQLTVTPKPIIYTVDEASGQYGNFAPCDDWRCNRWATGVPLGQARFEGVLAGDTVGGSVAVLDLNGRVGVIDSTTPVGTYFQVVTGLTGASAGNYRIADSGSRPGILTMKPVWMRYSTTSGVFLPSLGVVGQPGVATLEVAGRAGPLNGESVTPVVGLFDGNQQITDFPAYIRTLSPNQLNGRRFYYQVVGLQGPDAGNYRILHDGSIGTLDFYLNSALGLNYASTSIEVSKTEEIKPFTLPDRELKNTIATTSLTPDFGRNITLNSSSGSVTTDGTSGRVEGSASAVAGADVQLGPVNLSTQASGAAGALLTYGVTGVTLRANANSHIDVMMQVGPGYVMAGLQADAALESTLGPTGASLAAQVKVGASATTGASGSLGNGVGDGHLSTSVSSFAIARTDYNIGLKDQKLQQSLDLVIGSGVSAGARGGISGSTGAIDAGVTVYSPGTFGAKLDVSAGIKDGALTVGFDIGAQIGIAGLGLSFSFSIDPMAFAGAIANSAFGKAVLSAFGIDTTPMPRREWAPNVLGQADTLKNDPVARFKYLSEHPDWKDYNTNASYSTAKDNASYRDAGAFYSQYQNLLDNTARIIQKQTEVQARFMELLKTDPAAAIEYSRSGELAQMKRTQSDLAYDASRLGVQLAVTDGKVSFVSRPR